MTISIEGLKSEYPEILELLTQYFSGHGDFPCLFATAAFKKEVMRFCVVDNRNEIINRLSAALIEFSKNTKEIFSLNEKTYETLVLICKEGFDCKKNEGDFMIDLLTDLHRLDQCVWPEDKTKNLDDQDFEFYWGGLTWFPILMHGHHREKIRKSPYFMMGFQPGRVFEFNKINRSVFYERMRTSIHRSIKNKYIEKLPFYLGNESSGKNICQYSGSDNKEFDVNYHYPFLHN